MIYSKDNLKSQINCIYKIQGWLEISEDKYSDFSLSKIRKWLDEFDDKYSLTIIKIFNDLLKSDLNNIKIVDLMSILLEGSFHHCVDEHNFDDPNSYKPAKDVKFESFVKEPQELSISDKHIAYFVMGVVELDLVEDVNSLKSDFLNQILLFISQNRSETFFVNLLNDLIIQLSNLEIRMLFKKIILRSFLSFFFIYNVDPFYKGDKKKLQKIHDGEI